MRKNIHWRFRLTNHCNANCTFCHGEGFDRHGKAKFIPVDHFIHILNSAVNDGDSIALSGGEPLLHPDLNKIARWAVKKVGKKCQLNTNGIILEQKLKVLRNVGIQQIHINLCTMNDRLYKKIYRVNFPTGLWDKLQEANKLGIKININYVIIPGINDDINYIIYFINNCSRVGFQFSIIELYNADTANSRGYEFQSMFYQVLTTLGYIPKETIPGRMIYNNGASVVRVVAPCGPARAWNGSKDDDAYVVLESGEIKKFSTGELIESWMYHPNYF